MTDKGLTMKNTKKKEIIQVIAELNQHGETVFDYKKDKQNNSIMIMAEFDNEADAMEYVQEVENNIDNQWDMIKDSVNRIYYTFKDVK